MLHSKPILNRLWHAGLRETSTPARSERSTKPNVYARTNEVGVKRIGAPWIVDGQARGLFWPETEWVSEWVSGWARQKKKTKQKKIQEERTRKSERAVLFQLPSGLTGGQSSLTFLLQITLKEHYCDLEQCFRFQIDSFHCLDLSNRQEDLLSSLPSMISESGSVEAMLRGPGFPPFNNHHPPSIDHSRVSLTEGRTIASLFLWPSSKTRHVLVLAEKIAANYVPNYQRVRKRFI